MRKGLMVVCFNIVLIVGIVELVQEIYGIEPIKLSMKRLNVIPEASTLVLLGLGLIGVMAIVKRRK